MWKKDFFKRHLAEDHLAFCSAQFLSERQGNQKNLGRTRAAMNSGAGIFHAAYEGNLEVLKKQLEANPQSITSADEVFLLSFFGRCPSHLCWIVGSSTLFFSFALFYFCSINRTEGQFFIGVRLEAVCRSLITSSSSTPPPLMLKMRFQFETPLFEILLWSFILFSFSFLFSFSLLTVWVDCPDDCSELWIH